MAAGALYGGLGPGLAGLALSLLIDPDPVIGLTGAGLVAICIVFRQARSTPEPDASVRPDHASDSEELSHEFEAAPAALVEIEAQRTIPWVPVTAEPGLHRRATIIP